jgi:hypothetical protein
VDETLRKAINHLLDQVNEVVKDLLLIEVDWGDHTPVATGEVVEITFQGMSWRLVFTDSELVLRRTLCRAGPEGRVVLAFRNDNGFQIPLDIRALAHKSTPYRLGLRHRLYALTNRDWPPEVDYSEWRSSIERHADELIRQAGGAGLQWTITRDDLERSLVQIAFGVGVEGRQAPQLLADLVAAQRKATDPPTELELSLLKGQLRLHQVAWGEIVAWAAEEMGRAQELIRTGAMMGAERAARLMPGWGSLYKLRALLVTERQLPESDALDAVVALATGALSYLHPSTRQSIINAAESALEGVLPPDTYNPWFPSAWERESERLAQRLALRDLKALGQVARLHEHLFASQHPLRLSVLDEMERLVRQWEEGRSQADTLTGISDWAVWYAQQGARLDLTALKLMYQQGQGTGLSEPIQHLLDSYWRWRDGLNATFAVQFLGSYEAALHDRDSGVFGTHRVLDWVVRPLIQDGRRVLLLVVDGMGFAAFWHLLDHWAGQTSPVYARQSMQGLKTPLRATLSLLPSVTSVSRRGLFLNTLPTDRLDDEETYESKARVREAEALQAAFPGHTVKLYNKSSLGSGQELFNALQFKGADLVAVILNTIDDDIKSTTTAVRLPHLEDLGPLRNAVRSALDAGWVVLATSDHGHTWHRDKDLRRGAIIPGGGERFAPGTSEKDLPRDAIATQDPHIVRVQEGKKVVLLTATGTYFGQVPRRGYHGGASLEEVIIPCAFLTYEAPSTEVVGEVMAESEPRPAAEGYDLSGLVLTLPNNQVVRLELPFTLSPIEAKLLQTLARLGEVSEGELRKILRTRRIAGPLAALRDRLAAAGLDYIEDKGTSPEGTVYRFRTEMLGRET